MGRPVRGPYDAFNHQGQQVQMVGGNNSGKFYTISQVRWDDDVVVLVADNGNIFRPTFEMVFSSMDRYLKLVD